MDASLDTDIVIHLYKSGLKELLFSSFDMLFMYAFLFESELKKKAYYVYEEVSNDIANGKINIISNADLFNMEIKGLFDEYKDSNKYLFDQGELYAISLAKAMGIAAFVSDDTKEFGPHHILVRELIKDVMPFAFYELLFLKYLNSEISLIEMHEQFKTVTSVSMKEHPMDFRSRVLSTVRRFSEKYGTRRDIEWIQSYCNEKNINFKEQMRQMKQFFDHF